MKRYITILTAVLLVAFSASAQPRAIGIRAGNGGEISYQHSLSANRFVEADLGWTGGSLDLAGVYNFTYVWKSGVSLYGGAGAALNQYDYSKDGKDKVGIGVGVLGQMGIQYSFDVPVDLSLDWRPALNIFGDTGSFWNSVALGVRYRF